VIEGVISFVLWVAAEIAGRLGWDKLSERIEAREKADPRNWTPPR
jgi:hypothetical protein